MAERHRLAGGRMAKGQSDGIKLKLPGNRTGLFHSGRGILPVPDDGAAKSCHLDADLVVASGIQCDFSQGHGVPGLYDLIPEARRFGSRGIRRADTGSVGAAVFNQVVFQVPFHLPGNGAQDGKIVFAEAGGLKLPAEGFCCRGGFGKYEQPFHRLIQTVDEGQIRFPVFGLPAVQMIFQNAHHVGCADLPALGGNAGWLDTDKDVLIFEQDFRFHGKISFHFRIKYRESLITI